MLREAAGAPTDLPEKEPTEVIKPEGTPEPVLVEELDTEEAEESLFDDNYEEQPRFFPKETEEGASEELHEEEKLFGLAEDEEEEEIASDENEESIYQDEILDANWAVKQTP
ncbi:hypothetical protein CDL15_Pgr012819 [Punica granatum]|uniref:Uncharacterized protein n=1 Tax=Punica granatum TaxID=22663 RepID=A0A218XEU8_PUNGR|nr:hypothetical protein CDL15_Pgr012819 [Punica granatum]